MNLVPYDPKRGRAAASRELCGLEKFGRQSMQRGTIRRKYGYPDTTASLLYANQLFEAGIIL